MWTKFVVGFDVHGDQVDKHASESFFKFIGLWKPKLRIFGGDLWDFRPLRKKASDEEKRESMRNDFDCGMEWIKRFKPHFFVRGNHDERIYELAESEDGVRGDYASQGVGVIEATLKKMGCKMLPYHKREGVLRIGNHLKIVHGFASGIYASRVHALVYGSVLFGHTHAVDEHAIAGLERRVARNCGCLCKLDMDYNARQMNTLKQSHGWAYGVINDRTSAYHVFQAEEVGGKFVIPSDIVEL